MKKPHFFLLPLLHFLAPFCASSQLLWSCWGCLIGSLALTLAPPHLTLWSSPVASVEMRLFTAYILPTLTPCSSPLLFAKTTLSFSLSALFLFDPFLRPNVEILCCYCHLSLCRALTSISLSNYPQSHSTVPRRRRGDA